MHFSVFIYKKMNADPYPQKFRASELFYTGIWYVLIAVKGEQYIVLDDSQDHWWQVENSTGEVGFIPSNYVKRFDDLGLTSFDWYVGDMSRQRAESLLKSEDKESDKPCEIFHI